jgi:hypothetical protein
VGAQSEPVEIQDAPIPFVGRSLRCLVGELAEERPEFEFLDSIEPPETYDALLRTISYAAHPDARPVDSAWTRRVFAEEPYWSNVATRKKYKPVDRKVRPVPTYMPDPNGQVFKRVEIPDLPPLPFDVPQLADFVPTQRITQERLETMLQTVPEGFLFAREIDLLAFIIRNRETAIAFTDAERGTFSRKYFPDYQIPVIEHVPWVQPPIRIPKAIEETVRSMLLEQRDAGKYEYSTASYRSRIITVTKKVGIRIVHDVQELNKITIRDAALPPRVDDFAENHVGHYIYGLADLFSGYDGRILAVESRPLTTFSSLIGPQRLTVLPQGATNSVPEFQRCAVHTLDEDTPTSSDAFIDDITVKGPRTDYGGEEVVPGIRRFVYEYLTTLDRILVRFMTAGITVSGKKFILATPKLGIVGTTVSKEGWHLSHGLASKILKWPEPTSVTEVRGFLGTAGVGRKWIKGFSLIAKPLTLLTRGTDREFHFDDSARDAQERIKHLVATAPVLVRLDYNAAKLIVRPPRESDEGLVIVAVDSCTNGAGWVVYQNTENEKHPVLFGSCTFSEAESRYSQPKCELFGVFRALKDLRHRIWGIHFRLDVDAKFLMQMIKSPDLPNAPMTRWVMYLSLFDFEINHVPAEKHLAPDGLSRRKRSAEDSEEEDAEEYLDKFIGSTELTYGAKFPLVSFTAELFPLLMGIERVVPETPYGVYDSPTAMSTLCGLDLDEDDALHDNLVARIRNYEGLDFNPAFHRPDKPEGSLLDHTLLKSTDSTTYTGHEFERRRSPSTTWVEVSLGEEVYEVEITSYGYEYLSGLAKGKHAPTLHNPCMHPGQSHSTNHLDSRLNYDDVEYRGIEPEVIATIGHVHGRQEGEPEGLWPAILRYLKDNILPKFPSPQQRRAFLKRSRYFIVHEERLWKTERNGGSPRLVITDLARRQLLIAQAHNEVGHRGRDATYKLLYDRYYWPDLYDSVAYFVRSCYACQLRSRSRPRIPFSATWNTAILRRFDLDTVHMEEGHGGKHYLLQAIEPAINWPEARASAKNDSEVWAVFIYQEIICRFGCIPFCVTDGGPEFLGAAEILFKQYGIVIVISSPYHPQGNASVERAHQTLSNSIRRACGKDSKKWPLYVHAGLLAMRCTVCRMTGYTPYFLLYGRHPILAFDVADQTWEVLDWHTVHSTEDLIAIRIQQILRRDKRLVKVHENQRRNRERAVHDFNKKYAKVLVDNDFEVGTWVLVHETWLDTQMGNKGALRWSGPFIIHERIMHEGKLKAYRVRELDGNVRRGAVAFDRIKIFYYRAEHQTIRTYGVDYYIRLKHDFPDPSPNLHSEAYQRGVSLVRSHPVSYLPDIWPPFETVVPILDIGHVLFRLPLEYVRGTTDRELIDLSWEDPINALLEYEPFISTSKTRERGIKYGHPMIGDLDDLFQDGTTGVRITRRPRWGPGWQEVPEFVKVNVQDLEKWTNEALELRKDYR